MQREWSLKVRPDRVALEVRIEMGDNPIGLHRCGVYPRIIRLIVHNPVRSSEGRFRVSITEGSLLNDVRPKPLVKHRRALLNRGRDADNGGQWLIAGLDQVQRVLGN